MHARAHEAHVPPPRVPCVWRHASPLSLRRRARCRRRRRRAPVRVRAVGAHAHTFCTRTAAFAVASAFSTIGLENALAAVTASFCVIGIRCVYNAHSHCARTRPHTLTTRSSSAALMAPVLRKPDMAPCETTTHDYAYRPPPAYTESTPHEHVHTRTSTLSSTRTSPLSALTARSLSLSSSLGADDGTCGGVL
jgi:hypothetical protein